MTGIILGVSGQLSEAMEMLISAADSDCEAPVQPHLNSGAEISSPFHPPASHRLAGEAPRLLADTGNKTPNITWQQQTGSNRMPTNASPTPAIQPSIKCQREGGLLQNSPITTEGKQLIAKMKPLLQSMEGFIPQRPRSDQRTLVHTPAHT